MKERNQLLVVSINSGSTQMNIFIKNLQMLFDSQPFAYAVQKNVLCLTNNKTLKSALCRALQIRPDFQPLEVFNKNFYKPSG